MDERNTTDVPRERQETGNAEEHAQHSSVPKRGCKRRFDNGDGSKTTGKNEDDTVGDEKAKDTTINDNGPEEPTTTTTDLPEGMRLEWNAERTRAILCVMENVNSAKDREFRVCLVGRARISLIEGSAEVLGHSLEESKGQKLSEEGIEVTSPFWSSWMTIEADPAHLPCQITFDCVRGSSSFQVLGPKRPIVVPDSWKSCADDVWKEYHDDDPATDNDRRNRMVDSLEDYEDGGIGNPNEDNIRRVCMITGAKGVGKSTLLRYMTNRLLSMDGEDDEGVSSYPVAILDADVGQPELAPPGLLRLSIVRKPLLKPPYWNLVDGASHGDPNAKPSDPHQTESSMNGKYDDPDSVVEVISSVCFGAITSKVDPARYIKGIQFLMDKYETEVLPSSPYPIPLLINTDGWVKGTGYQVLIALIESLKPTHLVQILGDTKGQTFHIPETMVVATGDPEALESTVYGTDYAVDETCSLPKLYQLPACQTLPGASFYRIPASTTRNFRWATYFLPQQIQTFDAWDFASVKSLQTGWIVATNTDETTTVPYWLQEADTNDSPDEDNGFNTTHTDDNDNTSDRNAETNTKELGGLSDDCRLSQALARERPYCVPMEAINAFVIGSDLEDYLRIPNEDDMEPDDSTIAEQQRTRDRIFRALNGGVVALCTDATNMETIGYGILRSIDWNRGMLYVLLPPSVPISSLSKVTTLVGGSLPLPLAMVYRGLYAESLPYLTTRSQSLSSVVLGSEPMRSRNNISRRGLATQN